MKSLPIETVEKIRDYTRLYGSAYVTESGEVLTPFEAEEK